jgi:hypothetical protein
MKLCYVNAYYQRIAAVPHWAKTAPSSAAAVGRRPLVVQSV